MASITKTAKGYRAQVYVKGSRDSQTFRTKREAEAWASRRETELRDQQAQAPGERVTLAQMLRRYAEEVSPTKRGARWEHVRFEMFIRGRPAGSSPDSSHYAALPIHLPVGHITPEHIGAWRDQRSREVTGSSVLRELSLLSAAFEHARREWRLVASNPVRDVRRPRMGDHRAVVITRPQIKAMLKQMGFRWRRRPETVGQAVAVLFLVALRTGMRAGELCGLTWDRVYADHCTTPHKTGRTAESLRAVPLEPRALALIEQMRGWDEARVFGVNATSLDSLFRKYRGRAGLEGFTFHDSRHTAATWLARRLDVLDLCKMFGWAQTTQALTYYNPEPGDIARRITAGRRGPRQSG